MADLPLDARVAIHAGDFAPSTPRESLAVLAWQRYTNSRVWVISGVLLGGACVAQVVAILDRGGLVRQLIAIVMYSSIIVIWLVVIRAHRRQVDHMARQARAVLAREDEDTVG